MRVAQVLPRLGLRRKKTLHALERGATTSLTRLYGRSADGSRIYEGTLGGRWNVLTLLGAIRLKGVCAMMTIAAPADGDIFLAFVGEVLAQRCVPAMWWYSTT